MNDNRPVKAERSELKVDSPAAAIAVLTILAAAAVQQDCGADIEKRYSEAKAYLLTTLNRRENGLVPVKKEQPYSSAAEAAQDLVEMAKAGLAEAPSGDAYVAAHMEQSFGEAQRLLAAWI